MNRCNFLVGFAFVVFVAAGCSSSSESQMTSKDAESFSGKKGAVKSDAQKKAMADFQEEFKKKHPSAGPGAPPPG